MPGCVEEESNNVKDKQSCQESSRQNAEKEPFQHQMESDFEKPIKLSHLIFCEIPI